jgi:hypothetical protein
MDPVTQAALRSLLRTLLAAGGAWLVTHNYFDRGSADQIIGALMIIVPAAWGALDKRWTEQKAKNRELVAMNAGIVVADHTEGTTPLVTPEQSEKIVKVFQSPAPSVAAALAVARPESTSTRKDAP